MHSCTTVREERALYSTLTYGEQKTLTFRALLGRPTSMFLASML